MSKKSTVLSSFYLSGPMTGLPEFNYPAFNEATYSLRESGYSVFSPAESFQGDTTLDFTVYMREDIKALLSVDAVIVLEGWENSAGAVTEVLVALSLGLPILDLNFDELYEIRKPREVMKEILGLNKIQFQVTETILQEAQRLVHGDRQGSYGHPIDDFTKTAKIWTGILLPKLLPGVEIEAEDVPLCMVGVKLSREVNKPKRDNLVDGAGYFETLSLVRTRRAEIAMKGSE